MSGDQAGAILRAALLMWWDPIGIYSPYGSGPRDDREYEVAATDILRILRSATEPNVAAVQRRLDDIEFGVEPSTVIGTGLLAERIAAWWWTQLPNN